MPGRHNTTPEAPSLGGWSAVVLFIFTLFSFVAESQLTQYVQTSLGFRQPFFLFYIVHSAFSVIFPLHFIYLLVTSKHSFRGLVKGLSFAITCHLSSPGETFPVFAFLSLVSLMTLGLTLPALLWFAAISLTSVSDVTAIWNTNAFFAYLITVKLFNLKWAPRRLMAVCIATFGVLAVVYGDSTASPGNSAPEHEQVATIRMRPRAPLVGDLLTLIASIGYGLYQVLYKLHAALPNDPELTSGHDADLYTPLPNDISGDEEDSLSLSTEDLVSPPPFGLHPNLLTSCIGITTLLVLWIPIPFLHWINIEPFMLPKDLTTVVAIAGIALSGVLYNAGFMILLGVWGPIIVSVGNLLTIVLVFLSDILWGGAVETVTVWGVMGAGVIVAAFGVLAYDMFHETQY